LHAKSGRSAAAIIVFGYTTAMNSPSKRFVYYLQSAVHRNQRYSGLTSEVAARMSAHNAGQSPHTAKYRPWILLASIEFTEESRAIAFEQYLKSGSGRAFARRHFG
jgi:putative endonuclease